MFRIRKPAALAYLHAALLLVILGAVACGGGNNGTLSSMPGAGSPAVDTQDAVGDDSEPASHELSVVLAELEMLAIPAASPGTVTQLKDELARQLSQAGETTFRAHPPTGLANRVTDIAPLNAGAGQVALVWTELNTGDYNGDGVVSIADLTPIAVNFGMAAGEDGWAQARSSDGNGDGVISIADITSISQNFLATLEGYEIYRSLSGEDDFSHAGTVLRPEAATLANGLRLYRFTDVPLDTGAAFDYYVQPALEGSAVSGQDSVRITASAHSAFGRGREDGLDSMTVEMDGVEVDVLRDEVIASFPTEPTLERLYEVVYEEIGGELAGQLPGHDDYRILLPVEQGLNSAKVLASRNASDAADYTVRYDVLYDIMVDSVVPYAPPSGIKGASLTYSDPMASYMWGPTAMNCEAAWDTTEGGGVRVGVIDTGFDVGHEDLSARAAAGYNAANGSSNVDDEQGHGTHVAGTILATANNGAGHYGVASQATLVPIKAGGWDGGEWRFPDSDMVAAMNWVHSSGNVDVVNMSLGGYGPNSPAFQTEMLTANSNGIVLIAAAGNDNTSTMSYPAAWEEVLSVGAVGIAPYNKASYSNHGSWVKVCAPGGDNGIGAQMILSCQFDSTDGYWFMQGTSMACPHVAGVAALIKSYDGSLSAQTVRDTLISTGQTVPASGQVGPMVDANAALQSLITSLKLSGTITDVDAAAGLSGATVELQATGSNTTTDVNGYYEFNVTDDTYTVVASHPGYEMTPATQEVTVSGSDVENVDFNADPYEIAGTITEDGSGLSGVAVTVDNGSGSTFNLTTDTSGGYEAKPVLKGEDYTITPELAGYRFTPAARTVTGVNGDNTSEDFTADANTVDGTITDTSTGLGLSGVTVTLSGFGSVTTDGSGFYEFLPVPNGAYTITPSLAGYTFNPLNINVSVSDSDDLANDFDATPIVATYKVSGTISNSGAGVTVTLGGDSGGTTTTNTSGYYEFDLPDGSYTLTPTKDGWHFTGDSSGTGVENVTVSGADQTGIDFTGTANTISGTITAEGNPLSGVTVSGDGSLGSTTTNPAGYYEFTEVVNSSYTITPSKSGWRFTPTSASVTISDDSQTADFTATDNLISGQVTDSGSGLGIDGVLITLSGDYSATQLTAGGGLYDFGEVPNGNVTITPSKSGYVFTPTDISVVVNDDDHENQDFVGETSHTLSGNISGSGAGVTVALTGDSSGSTTTDAAGNYSFEVLDGSYTVTPSKSGWRFTGDSSGTGQENVTISGSDVTGVDFTGLPNTVSGTVTDLDSSANLSGVSVTLAGFGTTTTNGSGYYEFTEVPNATYSMTASLAGYVFSPPDVTISDNDQTSDFSGDPNLVKGTITELDGGAPMSGVTVTLSGVGTATTNGSGEYEFSAVPNGTRTITPSFGSWSFTPGQRSITVADGDNTGQDFQGEPYVVRISGYVTEDGAGLGGVAMDLSGDGYSDSATTQAGSGYYEFDDVPDGASYTVTPTLAGYGFNPDWREVNVNGGSVDNQNFTAIAGEYTVSGYVYEEDGVTGLSGVTMWLSGEGTVTTDGSGYYEFTSVGAGYHTLYPAKGGWEFTPSAVSWNVGEDKTQDFVGEESSNPSGTYTVSGVILRENGNGTNGVTVELDGPGGTFYGYTGASGYYQIDAVPDGSYTATPDLTGVDFTPSSQAVTVSGADVTGIDFTAGQ